MKRLFILAVLALVWAGTAADSRASSFGLFYTRCCNNNGAFCVRPYNAFSSVTCGVATLGSGCNTCKPFQAQVGPCGFANPYKGLLHALDCCLAHKAGPPETEEGAFGTCGPQVPFYGVPACRTGWNPGCNLPCNTFVARAPGHEPPPGPPVVVDNRPGRIWLPPQPFPGMYGIPATPWMGYQPMMHPQAYPQWGGYPAGGQKPQSQQGVKPVSYQHPQAGYGYQPMYYYNAYYPAAYQGWYGASNWGW